MSDSTAQGSEGETIIIPVDPSYADLVRLAGLEVSVTEVFGFHSGDLLFAVRQPATGETGVLIVGYGSCSACDSLEAFLASIDWYDLVYDKWPQGVLADTLPVIDNAGDEKWPGAFAALKRFACELVTNVRWGNRAELADKLTGHDSPLDWYRHEHDFLPAVHRVLEAIPE